MNKKGFTLIELVISIMIAGLILVTFFQVFDLAIKTNSDINMEFVKQSDLRYALKMVNNTVQDSTVGFVISSEDYQPNENSHGKVTSGLVKGWNYIGLDPTKTQIVRYKYKFIDNDGDGENDNESFDFEKEILFEAKEENILDFEFNKLTDPQDDSLVEYNIVSENTNGEVFNYKTELEGLNAIQIINWSGAGSEKGIAFAYRTEETPNINERTVGALSMVIDESGSMNDNLNGKKRVNVLKDTLNDSNRGLFAVLKNTGSYANIIPFSNNANHPAGFKSIDKNLSQLKTDVSHLYPNGGTNTGDGIRRGFYELKALNQSPPSDIQGDISNYMVVLVDGRTTFGTLKGRKNGNKYKFNLNYPIFQLGSEKISSGFKQVSDGWNGKSSNKFVVYGYGHKLDEKYGESYVRKVGNKINSSSMNIKQAFVIGYSDNYSDLVSLKNIATSLNISVSGSDPGQQYINNDFVFIADDKDGLEEAFNDIGQFIKKDLWQVNGPKLNP